MEDIEQQQEVAENTTEQTTTTYNDVEQRAMAAGWKPKDQFTGEEDKAFIPADEFLRRGELLEAISRTNKENKELKKAIDALTKHVKEERHRAYDKAVADLRAERERAIELGDKHTVYAVEQKLAMVPKPDMDEETGEKINEEALVKQFVEKNKDWFNETNLQNATLRAEAIRYEEKLAADRPDLNAVERLAMVEEHIKTKRTSTKAAVEVSTPDAKPSKPSRKKTYDSLNPAQKRICDRLVDSGAFTNAQEYVDALTKQGDL